jgi:glycine oxidase
MLHTRQVDYLIVGQGLAGSALAIQLIQRGKKVVVIDQPQKNTSSKIAAGLFNPVTGKKMTKTWLADVIFPHLHRFYEAAEKLTGQNFFHPMPLYRPFLTVEEQNEWMAKSADPTLTEYIETIFTASALPHVNDEYGGLMLRQSGYLDTELYMKAVHNWLLLTNSIWEGDFNNEDLKMHENGIFYKDWSASKIVFCQGEHTRFNPWFDWVPINALKGETLTVQTSFVPQQIINRGVYIVPSAPNEVKVGSTYNFQDSEPVITEKARKELEEKLDGLVNFQYEIVGQEWGKRPTTPDRRPILGAHPKHPSLIIFNGMGTKGVSLTPYFSDVLARWMEGEGDLHNVVDVSRYKSLYWKVTK